MALSALSRKAGAAVPRGMLQWVPCRVVLGVPAPATRQTPSIHVSLRNFASSSSSTKSSSTSSSVSGSSTCPNRSDGASSDPASSGENICQSGDLPVNESDPQSEGTIVWRLSNQKPMYHVFDYLRNLVIISASVRTTGYGILCLSLAPVLSPFTFTFVLGILAHDTISKKRNLLAILKSAVRRQVVAVEERKLPNTKHYELQFHYAGGIRRVLTVGPISKPWLQKICSDGGEKLMLRGRILFGDKWFNQLYDAKGLPLVMKKDLTLAEAASLTADDAIESAVAKTAESAEDPLLTETNICTLPRILQTSLVSFGANNSGVPEELQERRWYSPETFILDERLDTSDITKDNRIRRRSFHSHFHAYPNVHQSVLQAIDGNSTEGNSENIAEMIKSESRSEGKIHASNGYQPDIDSERSSQKIDKRVNIDPDASLDEILQVVKKSSDAKHINRFVMGDMSLEHFLKRCSVQMFLGRSWHLLCKHEIVQDAVRIRKFKNGREVFPDEDAFWDDEVLLQAQKHNEEEKEKKNRDKEEATTGKSVENESPESDSAANRSTVAATTDKAGGKAQPNRVPDLDVTTVQRKTISVPIWPGKRVQFELVVGQRGDNKPKRPPSVSTSSERRDYTSEDGSSTVPRQYRLEPKQDDGTNITSSGSAGKLKGKDSSSGSLDNSTCDSESEDKEYQKEDQKGSGLMKEVTQHIGAFRRSSIFVLFGSFACFAFSRRMVEDEPGTKVRTWPNTPRYVAYFVKHKISSISAETIANSIRYNVSTIGIYAY